MNLIEDPIFTINGRDHTTLPALFSLMAKGEVRGFPALRPHQRPAWHMFLVQLGALAAHAGQYDELPDDAADWSSALRSLTPDYSEDEPWRLVVENRGKPAFMQPPDPGNLKWSPVPTPDALDLLITSKNHDLKKAVARKATPEDWAFALVSLQTCEGQGGRDNYGIARMNRGFSSRPMLGIVPSQTGGDLSVNPSAWWQRDTRQLISDRRRLGRKAPIDVIGGLSLLWCLDWPQEANGLDIRNLDPWFIEVCRRVRLASSDDGVRAERATSKAARIQAKAFKGNVGDPWAPVHKEEAKALTLSSRDFNYALLCELLFSGDWKVPLLASAASSDGDDMLLVAEALSRGNSKTEGFKSRIINVPGRVLPLMSLDSASTLSKAQMEEVAAFDTALRNALALLAANGDHIRLAKDEKLKKRCYAKTNGARKEFDRAADQIFFRNLWNRLAAAGTSHAAESEAKHEFLEELRELAKSILEAALPAMPCAAICRPRAEARARRSFVATLRKNPICNELFNTEETNVAV